MHFKVNYYTFKGDKFVKFIVLPSEKGHTLKRVRRKQIISF